MSRCPDCGASWTDGVECRACFDALLAFENENPRAFGAVHHLTVPAYSLQHPAGYSMAALRSFHGILADVLDGRATPQDLWRQMSARFEGSTRAREPGAVAPQWWPREWPITVTTVLRPDESITVEAYVARALEWANATRATLDEAQKGVVR